MKRRCQRCGKHRQVGVEISGRGIPTCHGCRDQHTVEAAHDYYLRAPARALKPCRGCGGPKQRGGGRAYCDACKTPPRHCRDCGVEIEWRMRKCDACKLERRRATQRAWAQAHPEKMRAAQGRWRESHLDQARAKDLARWHRIRRDPVLYAAYKEDQRMRYRLEAERAGRPVEPVPIERYAKPSYKWKLPADPIRDLIVEAIEDIGELPLARRAGVSDRTLRRLINDRAETISVHAADHLARALGLHLDLIYEEAMA